MYITYKIHFVKLFFTQQKIKEEEAAMKEIALLTDIEFAVTETISDMVEYIKDIENTYSNTNKNNEGLYNMINSIKLKYKQFFYLFAEP